MIRASRLHHCQSFLLDSYQEYVVTNIKIPINTWYDMGSETIRKIRNKRYLYYIYYDNKKRKEVCCGLVNEPKTKSKLRKIKLDDLKKQKATIMTQINKLSNVKV